MEFESALWGFAGYLAGSIPFGLIFSNLFGLGDLRSVGSGNIGATNVLRTGNKTAAALTLLADTLKGFLIVWVSLKYAHPAVSYGVGIMAIVGHVWPVWLGFRGGKGVAAALGVYLAWSPVLGVITLGLWLGVAKFFRISSLSALVAISSSPLITFVMWAMGWVDGQIIIFCGLTTLLILYTHRDNVKRLIAKQEDQIKL
jgi:glycerol-3-phosphate acyltransferase PlsY